MPPNELLMIVKAYGLLAVMLFALSASDFVYHAAGGPRSARRNRVFKSVVALPLIVTALALLLFGMSHGSAPRNDHVGLVLLGALLPVAWLIIWSLGSWWPGTAWMLTVAALLGYLLFFNPAIDVRHWAASNFAWAQTWMARHDEAAHRDLAQSGSADRRCDQRAAHNGNGNGNHGKPGAQQQMASGARRCETAVKSYLFAAQQSDADAPGSSANQEYLLAKELLAGRQHDKGMQSMHAAAQRGSSKARLELATKTLREPGTFRQEVDALSELQALDRSGFLRASLMLASMYQSTSGLVPRNYYLARQLLRKAQADATLSSAAQRGLSRIPSVIDDLSIDADRAPQAAIEAWYQHAAAQTPKDEVLREQYQALLDHFADIDALRQRADSDDRQAQYQLAQTLQSHDLAAAMQWLRRAAQNGSADAQYELAVRMIRGKKNTTQQQQTLQQWAITAADGGHVSAIAFVAAQYESGAGGFTINADMAKFYYRRALQSNDAANVYVGTIAGRLISIQRASIRKALTALGQ